MTHPEEDNTADEEYMSCDEWDNFMVSTKNGNYKCTVCSNTEERTL